MYPDITINPIFKYVIKDIWVINGYAHIKINIKSIKIMLNTSKICIGYTYNEEKNQDNKYIFK